MAAPLLVRAVRKVHGFRAGIGMTAEALLRIVFAYLFAVLFGTKEVFVLATIYTRLFNALPACFLCGASQYLIKEYDSYE